MKYLGLILFITILLISGNAQGAQREDKTNMERVQIAEQTQEKWQGNAEDTFAKTDPELSSITNNLVYGEILSTGVLSDKQKALVILASLTTTQSWEEMSQTVKSALRIGVTPLEIREALYHCAPYVGIPRVKKAVLLANKEFSDANISLPLDNAGSVSESTRFKDGLAVQKQIFGSDTIENMQKSAPVNQQALITEYLSGWCFGDFYTRGILDVKMRELITFSAIVSLGGCNPQAQAHAKANLTVGNSADDLLDALAVMLPLIGYPRTLNGLGCVNAILSAIEKK